MKGIYNPKKLTTDRERFHKIRVLNIGAGAVGLGRRWSTRPSSACRSM